MLSLSTFSHSVSSLLTFSLSMFSLLTFSRWIGWTWLLLSPWQTPSAVLPAVPWYYQPGTEGSIRARPNYPYPAMTGQNVQVNYVPNYYLSWHTWAATALMVLLRMSPSWPLSKSRLIKHPPSATLTGDTFAGFPRWWLGLACLDLSVDPKSQILCTCKSTQICITSKNITNSTRIIYTAIHILTLELNPGRRVDLASWLW